MNRLIIVTASILFALPANAETTLSRAVQQGYDKGFRDCAPAIDKLVRFVNEDDESYAHFGMWSLENSNNHIFNTITSTSAGDEKMIVSFSAVKTSEGKCDVSVTQIIPIAETCAEFRETGLKGWKFYSDLNGSSIYEDPTTPNANMILSNQDGNRCLLVKQINAFGL